MNWIRRTLSMQLEGEKVGRNRRSGRSFKTRHFAVVQLQCATSQFAHRY